VCDYALPELEPRIFSFNNPMGACPKCDGLGQITFFDPKRVVAFPHMSLASGAIKGWDRRNAFFYRMLESLAMHYGFDIETAYDQLPESVHDVILHGSGHEAIPFIYMGENGRRTTRKHTFDGVIPTLERRYKESESQMVREDLAHYIASCPCPECGGSRLRLEARNVTVGGRTLHDLSRLPIHQSLKFFDELALTGQKAQVADKIAKEIVARLSFLNDVGLDYLSLDRSADTLSGGEAQRIRLASQIGSGLTGVMYVLDEPSIGLHQRDNDRLLGTLKHLRDLGNTVIVVEHDEDAIRHADYIVDMGPGAGEHGGEIVCEGLLEDILACETSLTADYLSGRKSIALPAQRRKPREGRVLTLTGASGNNLQDVTLTLPTGVLVCVTGVSGSGKSTLINDTLHAVMANLLNGSALEPAPYATLDGAEFFDKIVNVDQSPIGRTPRSNPATYTGLFTPIRELFAGTVQARERGYNPGRFSFNVKGGRCEACQGDGMIKVEMHFLPDIYVPCDVCHGKRYNRETLDVEYKGKNIHQILQMTVEEARAFFDPVPSVARKLQTLMDVGLSYVRLGQSATTLSGGEAQRVKLALELSKRDTGRTMYILDEPTTGLHFHDISLLLEVLQRLVEHGNTVVVIEHNLDVIKTADWIIDLGPEGGDGGGLIIAEGTPEQVAANRSSHTGRYLKPVLERHHG
jgi:excinuclease ABC subunit A